MTHCQYCPPGCAISRKNSLKKLGLQINNWDYVVALAGNPNTGKSTVFNALTGLHQHTGNWPGKTIARAEGGFSLEEKRYKLVDLPGTYSLLSATQDEEIARNFLLFGQPDVTVIVVDSTALERNLNLVLQILEITSKAVVALNLIDEAKAHHIEINPKGLAKALGVPVVSISARKKEGITQLLNEIRIIAEGKYQGNPKPLHVDPQQIKSKLTLLKRDLNKMFPKLKQKNWIALRLLEGDHDIIEAIKNGTIDELSNPETSKQSDKLHSTQIKARESLLEKAEELRWELPKDFHDKLVEEIYASANLIASENSTIGSPSIRKIWQDKLDWLLTSNLTGIPIMALIFAILLWLTIAGANIPSSMLTSLLVGTIHPLLKSGADAIGLFPWLNGLLIDGAYLTMAWVVSVMLPPMAIFFPLFTILEDFGYLPRVAFNLDTFFRKAGAHGKQALTMSMGYGCNAAGIIATRIIDSPREKLIAIITNNFALCNGRWPTQILIATLFLGSLTVPSLAGFVATLSVFSIVLLGIILTFIVSWGLSKTILKGESSTFSLELPPYRPPNILRTLYTSLINRTLFVLWRAIVFAVPAGLLIWSISNIEFNRQSLAIHISEWLDKPAQLMGLSGIILLAYIIAIPANEIVIPTILMLTVISTGMSDFGAGTGVLFETDDSHVLKQILLAGGWTTLTAINLMLFSLCHNPCSTTLYTIYKETRSWKWTLYSALIPSMIGIALCMLTTFCWNYL